MKNRFFELSALIYEAYEMDDFMRAQELIFEYQNLAAQNKDNWNYGNAIHMSNTYLGLIAISKNDINKAKEYLICSGLTVGSPQLNNFGPNMLLAKALLEKGEIEVVLNYIDMCKKFWNFFFRFFFIRRWKSLIKKNQIPVFGPHLYYHIKTT